MAKNRSSEILLAMQSDTSVMTAKVEHDELISQLNIIKKDLIFITDDTEKNKTRIDQCSHSLYSGGVKNPKELQDLQKVGSLIWQTRKYGLQPKRFESTGWNEIRPLCR